MNKKIFRLFVAMTILNFLPMVTLASPPPKIVDALSRMNRAHDRVSLTNLLGGLFLSDEQLSRLIPLAKQADEVRERYTAKGRQLADGATASYDQLALENIRHPQMMESEIQQKAQECHARFKELKSHYNGEVLSLQDKATAVLTPSQQRVVSTFKACIVPPRSLSDPTLVGQAQSTGEVSKVIDILRKAPQELYDAHKNKIADLALERVEKHNGLLREGARKALKEELIKRVDELRAMSAEDYALQSREKIDGLIPFDKKHPKDLSKWSPSPVGQFFLADGAYEILSKWRVARKQSPTADSEAQKQAALFHRQREAQERFENLAELGTMAYRALLKSGQLPPWLKNIRKKVEKLAKEKKVNEAANEIDRALTRLEEERGGENDIVIRGLNIRRLLKRKGLAFAAKNKKLDLFGLASRLENFQLLVKGGNLEEAKVKGKELQTFIEAFKD